MSEFVYVPVDPTDEMWTAGAQAVRFDTTILNKMWMVRAAYKAMIAAAPTQPSPAESEKEAVRNAALEESIVRGIAETISNGDGVWRSCTGCHELNEGHDTGAWSNVFKCHLGSGCRECGGIGAIWDDADYDAMVKSMQDQPAQPSDCQALFRGRSQDEEPRVKHTCNMGVGCEEAGVCYADAHGEPDRCGRKTDDSNIYGV